MRYGVIVGNIGSVYYGDDKEAAERKFDTYMAQSMSGYGRAGNEPVYMMRDGEIYQEYEV